MLKKLFKRPAPALSHTIMAGETGHSFTISPHTRASVQEDGVVFLHLDTGKVFRSNRVGAAIWRKVEGHKALDRIADEIGSEYGVPREQAARDASEFLTQLWQRGFVLPDAALRSAS